jgi:hypothetical protein
MSSKDFLKRVEVLMRKKSTHSAAPSTTDLRIATNELSITGDDHQHQHYQQQHQQQYQQQQYEDSAAYQTYNTHPNGFQNGSSTSIYGQQQYLPYPNRHPLSDFVPSPIATTRHSSLHNHPSNINSTMSAGSPTSPTGHSGDPSQLYLPQSQQIYQQRHSLNDPASPSEYSPSPLRQQELQS